MTGVSAINGEGSFVLLLNNLTSLQNVTFNQSDKGTIILESALSVALNDT